MLLPTIGERVYTKIWLPCSRSWAVTEEERTSAHHRLTEAGYRP